MVLYKERIFDSAVTIAVSPLVVFYWAGTWQLLDVFLFPDNVLISSIVSIVTSLVIMGIPYFLQDLLNSHVTADRCMLYFTVSRLFTYITAFGFVNNWRGMWKLTDYYIGVTCSGAIITTLIGVLGLVLLRSYRNVLAPPGVFALDVDSSTHFTVLTRYRTQRSNVFFTPDVLLGLLVISPLVLLVWRGKWQLLILATADMSDLWWSTAKTGAATALHCISCYLQYPLRRLVTRLHTTSPWKQLVVEDAFVFVVCWTSVIYWQGSWALLAALLADFDQHIVLWPVHFIGFVGLMVLSLSTSLQFGGFFIDGEFPDGLGLVVTPTYFETICVQQSAAKDLGRTKDTSTIEISEGDNLSNSVINVHM